MGNTREVHIVITVDYCHVFSPCSHVKFNFYDASFGDFIIGVFEEIVAKLIEPVAFFRSVDTTENNNLVSLFPRVNKVESKVRWKIEPFYFLSTFMHDPIFSR